MKPTIPVQDGMLTVINDRFVLEKEAGRGGMGVVYRAMDLRTGKPVAIKLVRRVGRPLRELERFEREAQVLSTLRHPAIVAYVAHGSTGDGARYLAMEWLNGEPLTQRLRRGPLDLDEALVLAKTVAGALVEAHRQGVMHRDIKPSNLFLRDGKIEGVMLLDFGIARGAAMPVVTATGILVGTPDYMSPEQARGRRDLTPASDIFSLGCVLFEALSSIPPFVAEQIPGVLAKILFEEPPKLRSLRPDLSESVEDLIGRMLAKELDQRIGSAEELLHDLDLLGMEGEHTPTLERKAVVNEPRLTASEQVLVSVLVAVDSDLPMDQATLELGQVEAQRSHLDGLSARLSQLGGRVEWLADGSLVVTFRMEHGGFATDQATQAARGALLVKELWPVARAALTTGRGQIDQSLPVGEAIDRALRLIRMSSDMRVRATPTVRDLVRIDQVTAGLLDGWADLIPCPDGSALLIALHRDLDTTRPLLGRATPCVGREQELLLLDRTLQSCADDSTPRAVIVTAPPGTGKSRLRHEFLRRLRLQGKPLALMMVRAEGQHAGGSYGLVRFLIWSHLGIEESDPLEQRRKKIISYANKSGFLQSFPSWHEFLGELVSVPFPDEDSPALRAARRDPALMSDQLVRVFLDFLEHERSQQQVLIIIDDLQWADAVSVKLLDRALKGLNESPIMILALGRPELDERFPDLWSGFGQRLRLPGLTRKAAERLIHAVLGDRVAPDVVSRIIAQADGNALFLEELIRNTASPTGTPQSNTVLAMLQSRIGRLPAAQRLLLRAASVVGSTFWRGLLATMVDASNELNAANGELDGALVALVDAEIIVRRRTSRMAGDVEYYFRHALLREAAYSLLTDTDRLTAHCLVARYLTDREGSDPLVIAEHLQQGGQRERAVPYYVQAASHSYEHYDLAETRRRAELGIACGASGETKGMLFGLQAWTCFWVSEIAEAQRLGLEALGLLRRGSGWWCRITGLVGASMIGITKDTDTQVIAQILIGTRPESSAHDNYLEALAQLLLSFTRSLDRDWSKRLLVKLEQVLSSNGRRDGCGAGLALVAQSMYLRAFDPDPWRQLGLLHEAQGQFTIAEDRRLLVISEQGMGELLCQMGDFSGGIAKLRGAVNSAKQLAQPHLVHLTLLSLANALTMRREADELAEAKRIASDLLATTMSFAWLTMHAHVILARASLLRGEIPSAKQHCYAALDEPQASLQLLMSIRQTLIQVLLQSDHVDEALHIARALEVEIEQHGHTGFQEIGLRVAIAEAYDANQQSDQARRSVQRAMERIQAWAKRIPQEDLRQRFLTEIPEHALAAELSLLWSASSMDNLRPIDAGLLS